MEMENTDLFGKFARIGELLHRQRHWAHRAHGPAGNPHRGQGRVMAMLKMQPEISQRELSYLLDIRPQSLGELLTKLERGGYITRTPSATDRRGMDVKLTEAGLQAAEQSAAQEESFTSLSKEEQATLGEYLDRIIGELEQALQARREDHEHDGEEPHGHRHRHGPEHGHPHERDCRMRHRHGMFPHGHRRGFGREEGAWDGPEGGHGRDEPRGGRDCNRCSGGERSRGRGAPPDAADDE